MAQPDPVLVVEPHDRIRIVRLNGRKPRTRPMSNCIDDLLRCGSNSSLIRFAPRSC